MPPLLRKLKPDQKPKLYRPRWSGMGPDVDPSGLEEGKLHLSINSRSDGGQPVMRGGQRIVCNLGERLTGLATHKTGPRSGPSFFDGGTAFNEDFSGGFFRETGLDVGILGIFGDDLYCLSDSSPRTLLKFTGFGNGFGDVAPIPEPVVLIPSPPGSSPGCLQQHDDVLLIGDQGPGVADSVVWAFDGVTLIQELSGIGIPRGLFPYNGQIVLVFNGTPNSIRVRSSAGVWSAAILPGSGTVKAFGNNSSAQYLDKLWIPTGAEDIFTFDSSAALTQIPIGTTGITAGGRVIAFAVLKRVLYFIWQDPAIPKIYVGKYDGTTWDATFKDLTGQSTFPNFMRSGSTLVDPVNCLGMRTYRGALLATCFPELVISPGTDIAGTWFFAGSGNSGTHLGGVVF